MAPFATLYTTTTFNHPQIRAAANINRLELYTPPFKFMVTNKTPEYLSKFPLGKIPALETASGFRLSEAMAIAHYISDSGPKRLQLLGRTAEERAEVQKLVSFVILHFQPTTLDLLLPYLGQAAHDPEKENTGHAELQKWLGFLEGEITGKKWFLGDGEGPSLADLTVGGTVAILFKFYADREDREKYPLLTAWFERLVGVSEVKEGFGEVAWLEKRVVP